MGGTEVSQIKSLKIGQVGASVQVQSPQVWQHHCSKRLAMPNILSLYQVRSLKCYHLGNCTISSKAHQNLDLWSLFY